jgi:hypothetical protein
MAVFLAKGEREAATASLSKAIDAAAQAPTLPERGAIAAATIAPARTAEE